MAHTNTSAHRARLAHADRREEIIRAVIAVCAERGISGLSISSVTAHVGCTRSLFYHYFPNKEAALEAALDYTIDRFIERLQTWNDARESGNIEGALDGIAALIKSAVLESAGLPSTIATNGDAILYTAYVDRIAERCARYLCDTTVVDFAAHHDVLIDHVYDTFYVLISGLILYIRSHPAASEELIKDIIASTLHIEGYTLKHAERRPAR